MPLASPIRRVAVIGAGPAGLASVKYLRAENYFEQIDVFEQRSSAGGTWNYTPPSVKSSISTPVPHLNPHEPVEEPIWINQAQGAREASFVSPVYDKLETNIPKDLMKFSDQSFPEEAQLFPTHGTVKNYLDNYSTDVKGFIKFNTQVKNLRLHDAKLSNWDLTTANLHNGSETTSTYDAVVVASGHFTVPYLPDVPGIQAWDKAYLGAISHSKFYDSAQYFRDRKVVVVGNSASGLDIGAQINEFSKGKVIVSQKAPSYLASSMPSDKLIRPEIALFLSPTEYDRGIQFADGHIEEQVDAVVFCTGYFYSFPFLSSLQPPVVTDGLRTRNVYQQLFYIEHSTLAFPVLPQRIIPFPVSENQAAVLSRVWSGRISLPETGDMRTSLEDEIMQKGDGKTFHLLPFPMDADYMNHLYHWAAGAETRAGLVNDGQGKLGTYWGPKERWMRALFPDIRRAFVQKGDKRSEVKTLAALGFDFEAWKLE
ncbi:hypothetical protein N7478_005682 [Penicillium angulare]|uniref:uncharacterized protein n=1 Tax=Penicillium angulare TaxID=116970 RepID=UPI002540DF81|nr:uncharacterized protein N7478_005682 [Penicillium angulare]KAJ5280310.1 hypothetical protein N7478_005682 [Penicillium angulare]